MATSCTRKQASHRLQLALPRPSHLVPRLCAVQVSGVLSLPHLHTSSPHHFLLLASKEHLPIPQSLLLLEPPPAYHLSLHCQLDPMPASPRWSLSNLTSLPDLRCPKGTAQRSAWSRWNSHSGDVFSGEGIGGVADEKARLAHGSERQETRSRRDQGHGLCLRQGDI